MTRETLEVAVFGGVYPNIDPEDLKQEMSVSSLNCDPESPIGTINAIKASAYLTGYNSTLGSFKEGKFIRKDDGTYTFVYHSGNSIHAIEDFYGEKTFRDLGNIPLESTTVSAMSDLNKSVYIGFNDRNKYWVGYPSQSLMFGAKLNFVSPSNPNMMNLFYIKQSVGETPLWKIKVELIKQKVDYAQNGIAVYSPSGERTNLLSLTTGDSIMIPSLLKEGQKQKLWLSREFPFDSDPTQAQYIEGEFEVLSIASGSTFPGYSYTVSLKAVNSEVAQLFDTSRTDFGEESGWRVNVQLKNNYYKVSLYDNDANDYFLAYYSSPDKDEVLYSTSLISIYATGTDDNKVMITGSEIYPTAYITSSTVLPPATAGLTLAEDTISQENYKVVSVTSIRTPQSFRTVDPPEFTFGMSKIYSYKVSLVYENGQETSLSTPYEYTPRGGSNEVIVAVKAPLSANSPRIKRIGLYRADKLKTESDYGYHRLVGYTDLSFSSPHNVSGTDIYYYIVDKSQIGASYEDMTGVSEEYQPKQIKYSFSFPFLNYNFIGGVNIADDTTGSDKLILKSKAGQFSIYQHTKDFLYLPEAVTALGGYNYKLMAFSSKSAYKIDPYDLSLEDSYMDLGVDSKNKVISCERGIFWVSHNSILHYDGQNINRLEEPVRNIFPFDLISKVVYVPKKNMILFLYTSENMSIEAYAYHLPTAGWYPMSLYGTENGAVITGAVLDRNLDLIIGKTESGNTDAVIPFKSDSYQNWQWTSKEFNMDDPSQEKKVYRVLVDTRVEDGGNLPTVACYVDGAMNIIDPSGEVYFRGKRFQVSVEGTGGTYKEWLRKITIIYRRLRGKR